MVGTEWKSGTGESRIVDRAEQRYHVGIGVLIPVDHAQLDRAARLLDVRAGSRIKPCGSDPRRAARPASLGSDAHRRRNRAV